MSRCSGYFRQLCRTGRTHSGKVGTGILLAAAMIAVGNAQAQSQLRFAVAADPKTFDPLLATEDVSDTIRYLTGGVLIRFNRSTQRFDPELAVSWKVADNSRRITFVLRKNVTFSDGVAFSSADVVATMRRLMTPGIQSSIADTFRSSGGEIKAEANGPSEVAISFSAPVAGLEMLFDQLAIVPSRNVPPEKVVLGPFMLDEHKGGQYILLKKNPHYWKTGPGGAKLPYLDSVRLDIQSNRETELLRFRRGELHLVDKLEPESFERLSREPRSGALNAGASLDVEFLWFNQSPAAHLPAHKRQWFASKEFRRAISAAINRDDIVRLVYLGYAHAAVSPVSQVNRLWFDSSLGAPKQNRELALSLLKKEGFQFDGKVLRDRQGNAVEFSLVTSSSTKPRTKMAAIVQQDLAKIGVHVNFVPLEFQSLIPRITRTQDYETCLLGLTNVEIDPNSQMNVWQSSGTLHPWSPAEAKPATPWEAEIDRLMQMQHSTNDPAARKKAFDGVQEILAEQAPVVFLVHPDVLLAVSPALRNAVPSGLPPHLYWNIEHLSLGQSGKN